MREPLSEIDEIEAALIDLLRAPNAAGARKLPAQAWPRVVDLALRQGVAPLVHRQLQAANANDAVPEPLLASLEQNRRATAFLNLHRYGQFRRVARALGQAGIPLIPLKGLHLAALVYRDIGLRSMSDLDVLVPRERVADALKVLRELGFGHDADLSDALAGTLDRKCNIGLAHAESEIWLELHWALDEVRDAARPMPDIWRSAQDVQLFGADAKVMSPEFLLLHVCAHLACNHAFAFTVRALCDIAEIVRVFPDLRWNAVVEHGLAHSWARGVAAALRLAREQLDAPIPASALAALGADALDASMLRDARAHLFETSSVLQDLTTAPSLLAAASAKRFRDRAALLWARILVPRAELSLLYGIAESSPRLPLYYVLRLRDLVQTYAASAWALGRGDPGLTAAVARHARLASWVREAGSFAPQERRM